LDKNTQGKCPRMDDWRNIYGDNTPNRRIDFGLYCIRNYASTNDLFGGVFVVGI